MRFWPRKAVEEPVDPPTKPEDRTREVFGLSCPNHSYTLRFEKEDGEAMMRELQIWFYGEYE